MKEADFVNDISYSLAASAHAGTSFVPEERAKQEQRSYAAELADDWQSLERLATTETKRAVLALAFAEYRAGYRARYCKLLAAKSRCLSTMITGPSGFPVRRASKANDSAHSRLKELVEYREHKLKAIRKAMCPELAPIATGASDADQRLRDKLVKLERLQEQMKSCNAAIRKHAKAGADAQIAAIVALGLMNEEQARKLLVPDFCGRIGFPNYELTNNGAEIRRVKVRLALVEKNKAASMQTLEGANARLEDCPADDRVRLFFPGKPSADVIGRLKAGGFRWTPSLMCWQAYRKQHAYDLAKELAGPPSADN